MRRTCVSMSIVLVWLILGCQGKGPGGDPPQNKNPKESATPEKVSDPQAAPEQKTQNSQSEQRLAKLEQRVQELEQYVDCMKLRDATIAKWRYHKPSYARCRGGGRNCGNTGLRPGTIQRYRNRLDKIIRGLKTGPEQVTKALGKLGKAPIAREGYKYGPKKVDQGTYLKLRASATEMTKEFQTRCFPVLFKEATGGK